MELFNQLTEKRSQEIEDFLSFLPIYESKRRARSLNALLKRNHKHIRDKVVLEAGAGRGLFARGMAELGAKKVIAVERSAALYAVLKAHLEGVENVELIGGDIINFVPEEKIDLLFHEFYGPLVLDETILVLNGLKFDPGIILPDGGRLWAMPIREEQILACDPTYEPSWREALSGAMVSDLLEGIPFRPEWEVFHWRVGEGGDNPVYEFELPESADFLAFCGEITHQGKHVLNMWWTYNWPIIYAPVEGKRFRLDFDFDGRFTDVYFEWKS
ncbi:MAG: rRNA adenine N-6-methyltransferase family protein [Bacteroidota bacterium]